MINQTLTQKQGLKILPQQIQLLNFFRLNQLELEHRIQQELEENPLLEKGEEDESASENGELASVEDYKDYDEFVYDDIPDYKLEYANYLPDDSPFLPTLADSVDFREEAKQQYRLLWKDEAEWAVADFIIDSLNDSGMLEQDVEQIAENYSFKKSAWVETDVITDVIKKIHQLDPIGIGAADTRECLLIQLERMEKKGPDVKMAIHLLRDHYEEMKGANMEKICQRMHIEEDELKIILQLIATLKMRPVTESNKATSERQKIVPDFIVRDGDKLEVELFNSRSATLHINTSWKESVEAQCEGKQQKETKVYLKNKLQSAQWFIDAIRQRETNMLLVMKTIVKLQYDYFKEGDIRLLKPMILKNVADLVNLDISTISRITSNKYVETNFGTILLKDLFTEGLVNEKGESTSNRVIQSTIEEVIRQEDKKKPLTDQQLVAILAEKGYSIARRTVAKYRELLQIPVAHLRGIWS